MWAVIKCDPKKLELMKSDISNKLNGTTKYYSPKILIQYYLKNRLISKKINLLGDYIFCFNSSLSDINSINLIRFSRGLKYFLNGYTFFQHDINKFIQL